MTDRPTAAELIDAVKGFLETEALPALTDARLRYQLLVAIHVLAIATRELPVEEAHLEADWQDLAEFLGEPKERPETLARLREKVLLASTKVSARIRAGEFDQNELFKKALQLTRRMVERKVELSTGRTAEKR